MATIRWRGPADLYETHRTVDQLFDQLFAPVAEGGTGTAEGPGAARPLAVDILETDDEYTLYASVAGVDPETVEVTYDDGILSVFVPPGAAPQGARWLRRERVHGSLVRKLQLPSEIRPEGIEATFDRGVIRVAIPKSPRPQPVRIPVAGRKGSAQSG